MLNSDFENSNRGNITLLFNAIFHYFLRILYGTKG